MDAGALERDLRLLHSASFGWALACSDYRHDEAEELLQTVYLKLIEGRAIFSGRSSFKTWLFAVIRTTAKERRRRRLRDQLGIAVFGVHYAALEAAEAAAVGPRPETDRLARALRQLPRRQREVLELVFYHELSVQKAAGVMSVSVGTARTHYERGKKKLRDLMGAGRE